MNTIKYFILFLVMSLSVSGENIDNSPPLFLGLTIGMPRGDALEQTENLKKLFCAEIITDSSTIIIHACDDKFADTTHIKSVKLMFNRKKTVQAIIVTFKSDNAFTLLSIVEKIEKQTGFPDNRQKTYGFSSELEWKKKRNYEAHFFSAEHERESYFLFATSGFMKEENKRSTQPF